MKARLQAYLEKVERDGNPITEEEPWQPQEFLQNGTEYSVMIVVRDNHLVTVTCCPSSASQLNYVHVEIPCIRAWLNEFMNSLRKSCHKLTGQLCLDFMIVTEGGNQVAYPIECNPRVHTQCTIYNRDDVRATLGSLLLESNTANEKKLCELLDRDYNIERSEKEGLNVYWFYNEFFKIFPNSWLLSYNDDQDGVMREKMQMFDIPSIDNRTIITFFLYLPSLLVSVLLCLPIILGLLLLSMNGAKRSNLSMRESCWAVFIKALAFLSRLAYLHENAEGDFW